MVTYKGLREKVIESGLRWNDVRDVTGISAQVVAKINKNEYVSLRNLEKFADYFDCDIGDLVGVVKNAQKNKPSTT